jgi:PAS domain S-box-containing protein
MGSGEQYWKNVRTYPLEAGLAGPLVVRDAAEGLPDGVDFGELRFMAAAPLRTLCGQPLGILVIADRFPRPDFSTRDLGFLVDFAFVATISLEARIIASHAAESKLQLQESEARFRDVADAAPLLIARYAASGACTFVNRAWLEFTGRTIQEELGDGWNRAIHPQYREAVLDAYWRACQARQKFAVAAPMLRRDGVFRWVRWDGTPRLLEDHSSAGFLIVMAEIADYDETSGGSGEESQCLAALAAATRAEYPVFSPDGLVEHTSPGLAKLAEATRENVCGRAIGDVLPKP